MRGATVSPLAARGYTVVPEPQRVELAGPDVPFGPAWRLESGAGVTAGDSAVESLREDLKARLGLEESRGAAPATVIALSVRPGAVEIGKTLDPEREKLAQQAYRLRLASGRIEIQANAAQGLFYGVQTLVQILKRRDGRAWFPAGTIMDWPDLQLRQIYWDDAHHLEPLSELKRAVRQAAFFKVNAFSIKLEGHFQFKSAPALVEPYALTPAEFQELTDYGLRYHVQVIPWLDGPAHIAFILKHPEYRSLRAFADSNYELCTTNPDSYKLLEGMFQDLIDANRGGRYFVLSTDEAYYVGMADSAQCREKDAAERLGSRGKLLAEFVSKASKYLHDRGREVIFWGEYPLKVEDIPSLPSYMINGEVYGPAYDAAYKAHGIRQTIYTAIQGEEQVFPDYFLLPPSRRLHPARGGPGRVAESMGTVSTSPARGVADLRGMVVAGWADAGQHPENFWLGYVGATAAGWHPGSPDESELMGSFFTLFYGDRVTGMHRAYQLLSGQAQFWADSWETRDSTARKPIWGDSEGQFTPPHPAEDQALPLPPVPLADLSYTGGWRRANGTRLGLAREFVAENDEVQGLLTANLGKAEFNRYNLEVLLSAARLTRHNLELLEDLAEIDESLDAAQRAAAGSDAQGAVRAADQALDRAARIRARRNAVLRDVTATWQKTWLPRGGEANGRRFLHELDDVKDHRPDRTEDMSYLVYRELLLPFDDWVRTAAAARNAYARAHNLPEREVRFDWRSLD
ncbi:MAG TPA: beta-N-acetylhexosaminidase [Bryobacteraceae bacterium]|nr:beta-N-acetylhexosaminidase [Bryobacteraceae bacterium]